MNSNGSPQQGIDLARFEANQRLFPPEQLTRYRGQHIAWNADGTRILASGDTYDALFAHLDAAGISVSDVVCDYIDVPA